MNEFMAARKRLLAKELRELADDIDDESNGPTSKRDAAQAEVERLTQELDGRRATNQRIMTERNAALNEVERLRAEVERLRASGQGMLDTSRPTDEDIWREAFITMLPSYPWEKAAEQSDRVLVEYRKRWPR